MYILMLIMLTGPALIGVMLYEKFRGCKLSCRRRIELLTAFAFMTNMAAYAAFWLRGRQLIVWAAIADADVMSVSFVLQYMGLTLVAALALGYVLSLVRIGRSRKDKSAEDIQESGEKKE